MSDAGFRDLDQRTVAIVLTIGDEKRVMRGIARYVAKDEHGGTLQVAVSEPAGAFDLMIDEAEARLVIQSGEEYGCDFVIYLDARRA
jgi:hypothetical protein